MATHCARKHFAALREGADWALLENAGGSQVPEQVVEHASSYFRNSYVQLGAGYEASLAADATVASARRLVHALCSADESAGFAALGASTTCLLASLALALEPTLSAGDVLIVSSAGHESNVGPWVRAAARTGARLLFWHPEGDHGEDTCPLSGLRRLLADEAGRDVRLVAFPHVSNLLGGTTDVAAIAELARRAGALSVCDGVAYAPHRRVDAAQWKVDFYAFSLYKVYGPHMAVLFGLHGAWERILREGAEPPNHYFVLTADNTDAPWYAWEAGGVSHEACAAVCGLREYMRVLAGIESTDDVAVVNAAFEAMASLEAPVQELMAAFFIAEHRAGRLRLVGPASADAAVRVPTFSFVPLGGATPGSVVAACHAARVAVRSGHMYAVRLCEQLGIILEAGAFGRGSGVVRVSAVHYNTTAEAQRCIDAIASALALA